MSAANSSVRYSVFVNTCDSFDDCWAPFFTLLRKNWPSCGAPIFLNTENAVWTAPDVAIHCTRVQTGSQRRLTWSECLLAGLEQVKTPLVLYLQEDYFINRPVRADVIEAAADYMMTHPAVKHVALTAHGSRGPHSDAAEEWLQTIGQRAAYRISTQAGLWRVETLRSYLRPEESGWMFEIFGTWRARSRSETFLCVRFDAASGGPAIDYLHTGIIKGKWLPDIQSVFERNNIVIDYTKRGFYRAQPSLLRKLEMVRQLVRRPRHMLRELLSACFALRFW